MSNVANRRVEKIDHAFELVLVLLSIISAALYQHATVEVEDLTPAFESISQALKFLFFPFLIIVPLWVYVSITTNQRVQTILRVYIWSLIIFQLFLLVAGFSLQSRIFVEYNPSLPAIQQVAMTLFAFLIIFSTLVPFFSGLIVWGIVSVYENALPTLKLSAKSKILIIFVAWITFLLYLLGSSSL